MLCVGVCCWRSRADAFYVIALRCCMLNGVMCQHILKVCYSALCNTPCRQTETNNICKRIEGAPIEMHTESGTLLHILVHHYPKSGQIVMQFYVYIYIGYIFQGNGGGRGHYLDCCLQFWSFWEKHSNVFQRNAQGNQNLDSHTFPLQPKKGANCYEICCIYSS